MQVVFGQSFFNVLKKSMNNSVTLRYFAQNGSRI